MKYNYTQTFSHNNKIYKKYKSAAGIIYLARRLKTDHKKKLYANNV